MYFLEVTILLIHLLGNREFGECNKKRNDSIKHIHRVAQESLWSDTAWQKYVCLCNQNKSSNF